MQEKLNHLQDEHSPYLLQHVTNPVDWYPWSEEVLSKAAAEDKKRLIEILNMHTSDQSLRNEAIAIIKKYGAFEHVKALAEHMVMDSWSEVDKLLPSPQAKEKLKAFAEFLITRSK
jgi:geranylgeranyl pyrophosphate synthase